MMFFCDIIINNVLFSEMQSEDNKNEKSYLNLFGMREIESTKKAIDSLK